MMFLQYFVAGAFTPVLSLYLKDYLHFSGFKVGMILSVTAAGSIVAPLVTSFIADRWISAERLLAVCHLVGGACMALFSAERNFWAVMIVYFGYTIITVPTFALANAIIFHHSPDSRHAFGRLRVWGTIGWIAVAWLFSFCWLRGGGNGVATGRIPDALMVASVSSLILGIYALTLPAARKLTTGKTGLLPIKSLMVLKTPAVARLCLFMLAVSFFYRFYYFGTAPFLRAAGFSDRTIMPLMSFGQIPEIFAMGILGWCLLRYGPKKIILLGLLLDIFRYAAAAAGGPAWLLIAGLSIHGLAYTFIYTTASIHLDRFCDADSRTGVHQLFSLATSGIGNFTGNLFCGVVLDACARADASVNYHAFWLVPVAGLSLLFVTTLAAGRFIPEKTAAVPARDKAAR
jgi:nucleoside transporter